MRALLRLIPMVLVLFLFTDSARAEQIDRLDFSSLKTARRTIVARNRRRRKNRPRPKPTAKPAPEPAPDPGAASAPIGGGGLSRTTRIEFDAQLIKGQTTKAGEVQILERKDSALKSMVTRRTSFREEIIHSVFPEK
ncbi:MAG TPA: hypothetical protein VM425_21010 [Myxococcota bacterium]|nr:hypothetical protein [Myxococcota bacterium]